MANTPTALKRKPIDFTQVPKVKIEFPPLTPELEEIVAGCLFTHLYSGVSTARAILKTAQEAMLPIEQVEMLAKDYVQDLSNPILDGDFHDRIASRSLQTALAIQQSAYDQYKQPIPDTDLPAVIDRKQRLKVENAKLALQAGDAVQKLLASVNPKYAGKQEVRLTVVGQDKKAILLTRILNGELPADATLADLGDEYIDAEVVE